MNAWLDVGFGGQGWFFLRFLAQGVVSENKGIRDRIVIGRDKRACAG
jgi:hypothetical protein